MRTEVHRILILKAVKMFCQFSRTLGDQNILGDSLEVKTEKVNSLSYPIH